MSDSTTTAGSGFNWLTDGLQLLLKNPMPFMVMGLILGVIGMIPILGGLAMLILGPALYAGMLHAYREQGAGRPAEIGHLFAAFQQEGKLPKLLPLCLPGIAVAVVMGILVVVLVVAFIAAAGGGAALSNLQNGTQGIFALLSGVGLIGGLIVLVFGIVLGLLTWALLFTAIPRVMFDAVEPFAAMKESLSTVKRNLAAFLTFAVSALFGYVVLFVVLMVVVGWILPILPGLLMTATVMPLIQAGVYKAYRQLFAGSASAADSAPPPAPEREV